MRPKHAVVIFLVLPFSLSLWDKILWLSVDKVTFAYY